MTPGDDISIHPDWGYTKMMNIFESKPGYNFHKHTKKHTANFLKNSNLSLLPRTLRRLRSLMMNITNANF